MKPILLRAFGRSGTTLMMEILKTSPSVLVPHKYPFESRFVTYFARLANLPIVDPNQTAKMPDWGDQAVNGGRCPIMSGSPYALRELVDENRLTARFLHALWRQFSLEIAENTGIQYRYYAEKVALDIAERASIVIPETRSLFIVRDPRGELASIVAFNNKRGYPGFGWKDDDTLQGFASRMIAARRRFFREAHEYSSGSPLRMVIKFEDLATRPTSVCQSIASWLDVDLDSASAQARTDEYSQHKTNDSGIAAAISWKEKLPRDVIATFAESMAEELAFFGYA